MTHALKAWLLALLMVCAFATVSVLWLDRPIAIFVHDIFGGRHVSTDVVDSPALSAPLIASFVFIVLGLLAIFGRRFSKVETVVLLCTISVLAEDTVKNQLKFVFGRTWPDSWAPNIQSLIRDNVYGFNFFHGGQSFESFPSGHAAVTAAVVSILWILYPRLRIACVICIGAADLGLILLDLHFLSDVVVGSFVGISAGGFTVAVWRAGGSLDCASGKGY